MTAAWLPSQAYGYQPVVSYTTASPPVQRGRVDAAMPKHGWTCAEIFAEILAEI